MTSNLGSEHIAKIESLGFLGKKAEAERRSVKEKIMEVLKEEFRPEFINRIDEIIIFNYLSKTEIKEIVGLELDKVAKRLKAKKIKIEFSEKAKLLLAARGFDSSLGARPLKRVIQREVLDPLALQIVTGLVKEGYRVMVDAKDNKIEIIAPQKFIKSKKSRKLEKSLV